jgi:hypothetical protein
MPIATAMATAMAKSIGVRDASELSMRAVAGADRLLLVRAGAGSPTRCCCCLLLAKRCCYHWWRAAGGDGHLPLTKKFTMQRVWSNLACAAMESQEAPRNNRVQEESCFSLLFDLAALREVRTPLASSLL